MAEPSETALWRVLAGVAGVLGLGWYLRETLKRLVPAPLRISRWLRTRDIIPSEGTHFTILIADLDDDDDQLSQTKHVEAALREQEGLEVVLVGPGPKPFETGGRAEHQIRSEEQGRGMLTRHNGDLLIWGEVAQPNLRVRLRFLPREGGIQVRRGTYQLEAAELPRSFGEDFNAQLIALALASLVPAFGQRGRYLGDLLISPAVKLERLLNNKGAQQLDRDQTAALQLALGNAARAIGEQTPDSIWLEKAIAAHRAALEVWTRERAPRYWAMIQSNLGSALFRLGEREAGIARLEDAVAALRAALEVVTREFAPLDWASVQHILGVALMALGDRKASNIRLEKAVAVLRLALEEYPRERVPLDWATVQNNLGSALATLGEREGDTARLEDAVAAYRAALEEKTRDRAPLNWAASQTNLGNALRALATREPGTARLEEAVAACKAALEECTRDQVPLLWAVVQDSLGHALLRLGERELGVAHLKEAVEALRAALEERTRDRLPLQWAATQNHLGTALLRLGERQADRACLEEAVKVSGRRLRRHLAMASRCNGRTPRTIWAMLS